MQDLKEKLAPLFKVIDEMDVPTVMAIAGIMALLTIIFGGFADFVALMLGVGLGFALYRKFFR
ncbi:hypothetical protein [Candidatus Synchoanobacter obligatus]|uniref:Uncharacterized protein n=1 Tax=Candidatus Synchoanobacter obligatus TaxID=2919597 RepID=A0ABT1L4Q6_9GAMM|nr:hypothetical protein [Candidatus Synchoanobacter obligatus]MCP8352160.1 hypothetical protein [Candidatus Synchoanobacter obligatus]